MYAFFDGDGIGNKIEILFRDGKIEQAKEFSESLKMAMQIIEKELSKNPKYEIIIIGGDDLLIKKKGRFSKSELEEIRELFKNNNSEGATFSCGIGSTVSESIDSLGLAKLYGRNRIISWNK
ncbi:MAG: mCpol domain-containing protein [Bacteroidota bacterium]